MTMKLRIRLKYEKNRNAVKSVLNGRLTKEDERKVYDGMSWNYLYLLKINTFSKNCSNCVIVPVFPPNKLTHYMHKLIYLHKASQDLTV